MKVKINTHGNALPEVHGEWIDLCTAEDVTLDFLEYKIISLGVSIEIPAGYYAMDIKSFKPRQTVYIVGDARRPRDKFSAVKAEVAKVGRKYVTISGRWGERFREAHNRDMPYLIEETEYGSPRLLFPSEDAVREYQEREELKEWVRVAAGWDKIGRYTLEQLRAVKKILEG